MLTWKGEQPYRQKSEKRKDKGELGRNVGGKLEKREERVEGKGRD